jgi:phosphoribosylformylglycinamidine cyclo-ligase
VLPAGLIATVDRATWAPAPIFELIRATGDVARAELERTFNLGVGMVAVLPSERAAAALDVLAARGVPAWQLGEIRAEDGPARVDLAGNYAGPASTWR